MTPRQPQPARNPWNILGWLLIGLIVAAIIVTFLVFVGTATLTAHP